MKKRSFHHTNMGAYAPTAYADTDGYITIHASERYAKASDAQLQTWLDSRVKYIRAAAATEIAERKLQQWRAE
jgi:predicted NBD/HSP70 family sugar kinase